MHPNIKTPSDLKYTLSLCHPNCHFFDRDTMQFFGDTMKNFGLRRTTINTRSPQTQPPEAVAVFELYRRKPVKYGLKTSSYFRQDNLAFVSTFD